MPATTVRSLSGPLPARLARAFEALLALLLALMILAVPRTAQAQGQCWQFESCPLTAPVVGIFAASQVAQPTVALSIYMSDPEKLNLGTVKLWKNGVDTTAWYATATSPFDPYQSFSQTYSGSLPLALGANTIIAEVCDMHAPSSCGRDTVVVTYTPPPATTVPVLTLMQRTDARNVDAGAATYDYATAPYYSMDTPRGVALHYSSATARPTAEIQVDAVIRSSQIPSAISIWVTDLANVTVYPETYFAGDTGTFRLAAKFDADCGALDLCSKLYHVYVRAYYGSSGAYNTAGLYSVRVLLEDARNARAGAGWTIAGIERLVQELGGIVVSNGAGLLEYFTVAGCSGTGANESCDYTSPLGDFSTLKKAPAHPVYGTRYFRAFKSGDTTFYSVFGHTTHARTRFSAGLVSFSWGPDSFGFRLNTITDPVGKTIMLNYEPASGSSYKSGSLGSIELPDLRTTYVRVSSALGDLTQIIGPDNVTDLTATYDGSTHRLLTHTERIGGGTITYDTNARVTKVMGIAVPLESGGSGADSVVVQPLISRALAGSGATYGSGSTPPLRADSAFSRTLASNGAEVSLWADALGGPSMVRSKAANGDTTVARNTYNVNGQLTSSVVTGQSPVSYTYDGTFGAVSSVTNTASGDVTSYILGPYGQVAEAYINNVLQSKAFFSGANLAPDSVRSDTANTTRIKYDAYGRVVSVRDARQALDSITYDATTGNVATQRSTAPGHATRVATFAYDASGRVSQLTDHLGRVATTTYDALNRTLSTTALGTDVSSWTYNDAARYYTFTDPNNNVYATYLNAAGWTTTEVDPYSYGTTYGYDRRGNIVRLTDRRGIVARWYKDALDRDTLQVAGSDSTWFAYDPNKQWVAVRNAESIDTLRVDAAGRPTSSVTVRGSERYITTRGWIGSLPDGVTFEGKSGSSTLWTRTIGSLYDAVRRTKVVVDYNGGWTQSSFDKDGAVKTTTLANNISTRTNTFSALGELTQVAHSNGAWSQGRTYQHDASSRIWQVLHGVPEDQYSRLHTYDSRDRLSAYRDTRTWTETVWQEWDPYGDCPGCFIPVDITHVDTLRADAWVFDKLGNRTGSGITYVNGTDNRLFTHGGDTLWYDTEGNVVLRRGATMGTVTYTWNALGQLATVAVNGGATTTYGYDGFGQRVRKTVNGVTTRYVVHDGQVALELTAAGGIVAEYTYYPGTDRPHGMKRGGVQYFYLQDAQGNVSGLVNASGVLVETYEYTPHGVLVGGGSGVTNPHRYKGREWDAESGLYYMRARYYDAGLGRFISEDPIGLAGGLNPYLFVEGDPVNYADPLGLAPCRADAGPGWVSVLVDETWLCAPVMPPIYASGGRGWVSTTTPTPSGRGSCGICGAGGEEVLRQMSQIAGPMNTGLTIATAVVAAPVVMIIGGEAAAGTAAVGMTKLALKKKAKQLAVRRVQGLQQTLDRIKAGVKNPHRRDGTIFKNRENLLPNKPAGYYKEYVHPTPGVNHAGLQRVVIGKNGETYFSPDHYETFFRVR